MLFCTNSEPWPNFISKWFLLFLSILDWQSLPWQHAEITGVSLVFVVDNVPVGVVHLDALWDWLTEGEVDQQQIYRKMRSSGSRCTQLQLWALKKTLLTFINKVTINSKGLYPRSKHGFLVKVVDFTSTTQNSFGGMMSHSLKLNHGQLILYYICITLYMER